MHPFEQLERAVAEDRERRRFWRKTAALMLTTAMLTIATFVVGPIVAAVMFFEPNPSPAPMVATDVFRYSGLHGEFTGAHETSGVAYLWLDHDSFIWAGTVLHVPTGSWCTGVADDPGMVVIARVTKDRLDLVAIDGRDGGEPEAPVLVRWRCYA